ncbi:VOC family protein [Georgenia sp. EYE_87]|uniref:VOC family protein n=1 Tax=Georgenia sp. EYE_87 TaxID=2853448 RepID=UPI0020031FAD|nr:VOC family protein [Georgenia sp. EYE_87]MCK6210848.1 VOC family protein [Georgenia sp. EYE_87]
MTDTVLPHHLDHVVVATPDLAAAVRAFEEATGVAPEPGGVHPKFGTRNYLVSFGGDAYLEIIGADPENTTFTGTRSFGVDDVRETAVVTWAVHPGDLDAARARAREAGLDLGEVFDGARRTTDGTLLEWRLTANLVEPTGLVPFLIDWGATTSPAVTTKARVRPTGLVATHPRPEEVTPILRAIGTDIEVGPGEPRLRLTVEGPGGSLTL